MSKAPPPKKTPGLKVKHFTPDELEKVRAHFRLIDTDNDGKLTRAELSEFASLYKIDPSFINLAFRIYDTDRNDRLDIEEFVKFNEFSRDIGTNPDPFYQLLFRAIDEDNDGALTAAEVQEFCELLGLECTEEQAKHIIQSMDHRGIGKLICEDLIRWLHNRH
jgi:Ca2+-binding EF-hand superfamily protein